MGYSVYLSPSNQTGNKYAFGNTTEALEMQKVGAVVEKELKKRGISVIVAKPSLDIESRGVEANKMAVDVYVAIHSNAGGGKGAEAYYDPSSSKSKALATKVYNKVAAVTPTTDRGIKNGMAPYGGKGLAEIRVPKSPVAETLVEVEFHDNVTYAKWIIANTTALGTAIAQGICEYLSVPWTVTPEQPKPNKLYRVQVGAFSQKANADKLAKELKEQGFDCFII